MQAAIHPTDTQDVATQDAAWLQHAPALADGYVARANQLISAALASCTIADAPLAGVRSVRISVTRAGKTDTAEVYTDWSPAPEWMVVGPTYQVIEDQEAYSWGDHYHAFFELWCDCADEWYQFACTSLHPDTRWDLDPMALGKSMGGLWLGMARTNDPDGPLDFDPTKSSQSVDQGVITFPLFPLQTLEFCEAGYSHKVAARMQMLRVVVAAYAHEGFELWQDTPGHAWINPHRYSDVISGEIEYADGSRWALTI